MSIAILVHGGVGPHDFQIERAQGMEKAVRTGYTILEAGGEALDAVQATVRVLEDDPAFNAGTGSVLNELGEVETDAALMDGSTRRAGAVGALRGISNPVELARLVLEEGRHVLLVGDGALRFARQRLFPLVEPQTLVTAAQKKYWADHRGTVGAVATDRRGHLASATSTGGIAGKHPGRLGDTPLIGSGTYADSRLAVSCTGDGESIIRMVLAHEAACRYREVPDPARVARESIERFGLEVSGMAGIILVDSGGRAGWASSPGTSMLHGLATPEGLTISY
jgi:beta-aspartyl-peptidase (threonine type)